uniref:uncharacterized protein LOC124072239 n=1 Tax=Scatophagus argus TaxID=75038 RepID=UPI001ED7F6C7|nr:uncharacterized protein LOC124072239 [Scatophagus argus]
MTRAALTKVFILVILAFIICLPEFFTLYRASKVNFRCLSYRPCERMNQVKTEENGKIEDAEIRSQDTCNPSQTPEHEKWEQACRQKNQSNMTDSVSNSTRGGEDPEKSWFMCETDMNMTELHSNLSSDLKVYLEVSVALQLKDAETVNLTLYGLSNHSSLHFYPPEKESGQDDVDMKDDEGQRKAFYCCLPAPPTSESANKSHCLLWFANQTVLNEAQSQLLSFYEWRCVLRVLWLVLLCVVLLAVVTSVIGQVYRERYLRKKPKIHPAGYDFIGQQLNGGEKQVHIVTPKGMIPRSDGSQYWSELSPIQEADSQDDIETLLDENADQRHTANLHHRSHHSSSSLTEEQAW